MSEWPKGEEAVTKAVTAIAPLFECTCDECLKAARHIVGGELMLAGDSLRADNESLRRRVAELEGQVGNEPGGFYLQNMNAGYVGNNPMFWAKNDNGYTSYIDNAKRFTEAEAMEMFNHDPHKWRVWPWSAIEACIYRTVECQKLNRMEPHANVRRT